MRDLQLAGVYFKTQDMRKNQEIDGEHENKMQVSLQLKDFVKWVSWTDCPANTAVRNLPPIP